MSSEVKEQVRARLDIADIVGEVVALKPSGRGQLKGLCPFHNEKTPSFHVNQDRGFYYCFGCQSKGDVFDFVMQTQGVEFFDALKYLGDRAGIEVSVSEPKSKNRRDLFELNQLALSFFKNQLDLYPPAKEYLQNRKLTEESILEFDLGYAPNSWDALLKFALTKGVTTTDLLAAGLIRENDSGRQYDYHRNRIIFPIKDYMGRVVGFSGRVLDDSLPKYLNTSETDIFKKAELLYGLDLAKHHIREKAECLVVEGYMDVIALHQTGFKTAVAALGATLTAEQSDQLSRLDVQRLFLAFDADEAGQRAILGGLEQTVGRQFLVKAIQVPHGKDPADAVLEGDIEAFRRALGAGLSEVEFRFQSVLSKYSTSTVEGKKNILNDLLPALRPRDVFDPVASEMRRLVIEKLNVEPHRLDNWLNSKRQRKLDNTQMKGIERQGKNKSQVTVIELEIIALLLLEPRQLKARLELVEASLPSDLEDSILLEFLGICSDCDFNDQAILMKYREKDEGSLLFERLFSQQNQEDLKIDVEANLERDLSRLRELSLTDEKEQQRSRLLERMQEVSRYLTDPNLPTDQLQQYYAELKEINTMLAARDAERRTRVPTAFTRQAKKKSF